MENKVSQSAVLAKKYIEEHDIEKITSEMLNSLVHEKSKNPVLYMIKYLAGLMSEEERRLHGLIVPEPFPKGKPIVKYPAYLEKSETQSILKKHLTKNLWNSIKYNKTKHGGNIVNIIKLSENPSDDKIGALIPDGEVISTFSQLLTPIISEVHNCGKNLNEVHFHHATVTASNFPHHENIKHKIDFLQFSYSRNLQDYAYSPIITSDKRQNVETVITKAIQNLILEKVLKECKILRVSDDPAGCRRILNNLNLPFLDEDLTFLSLAELKNSYPDNRVIFYQEDLEVIILINFIDHIQIIHNYTKDKIDFIKAYNNSYHTIKAFEKILNFDHDKQFGYINVHPALVGAGLSINTEINLINLQNNQNVIKAIDKMGFSFAKYDNNTGVLKTNSIYKLSYSSILEFVEDYYIKICGLISLDSDKELLDTINLNKIDLDSKIDPAIKEAYESVYEEYKYIFSATGANLNSVCKYYHEDPYSPFGILLNEISEYKTFQKFIAKYIKLSQNFDLLEHDHIHKPDEHKGFPNLTNHEDKLLNTSICLIRNIQDLPFVTSKKNENLKVEELVLKTLENLNMKQNFSGKYTPLIDEENSKKIIEENSLFLFHKEDFKKFGIHSDFPKNRGIVSFEKDNIHAVVNDIDHIKFILHFKDDNLQNHFVNVLKLSNEFSKHLRFVYDKRFGFLTACPRFVGTGLIIKSQVKLNNLSKNVEKLNQLLEGKDFGGRVVNEGEGIVEITNRYTVGKSETDLLTSLINILNLLFENESIV